MPGTSIIMSKTSQRVNNKTTGITLFMILYSLSGFAVMSMETIWIRTLALIIGNTVNAATAAICVFFIFAAFGNLIGGRLVHKTTKPAAWYLSLIHI